MKIVVLLGAPGSGKGTVAGRLVVSDRTFQHVSSGDLLRDAVKGQTAAGIEADGYMKRGELVPDVLIAKMILLFEPRPFLPLEDRNIAADLERSTEGACVPN